MAQDKIDAKDRFAKILERVNTKIQRGELRPRRPVRTQWHYRDVSYTTTFTERERYY